MVDVIILKTAPANPFFSSGGSWWTNDLFSLLDVPPGEDFRRHPRNRCIHEGFASMALVPIRMNDRIVGLIQFNDRRKDCFTLNSVELLEGIAAHIGAALMRQLAEEALRESEDRYRTLVEESPDLIAIVQDGRIVFINPVGARLSGVRTKVELLGRNFEEWIHPDDGRKGAERIRRELMFQGLRHIALKSPKDIWVRRTLTVRQVLRRQLLLSVM